MLQVVTGNRMEWLAHHLAERLGRGPLEDPIVPEVVLIPSRGMENWLAATLARHLGIAANIRFSFPAREVRKALGAALAALDGLPFDPEDPGADPWDPDWLTWAILQELPTCRRDPAFQALDAYLDLSPATDQEPEAAHGPDSPPVQRREHALAERIANLLDQYANYRPDWVRLWSDPQVLDHLDGLPAMDRDSHWQPILWQALQRRIGLPHPVTRLPEALERLAARDQPLEGLPPRLTVFGVSALPPIFLNVLQAVSARIPVAIYALSPVQGYYGHLRTRREEIRLRQRDPGVSPEDLHLGGPPLLQSLGLLGRDFNEVLAERLDDSPGEICRDPVADEARTSMLAHLQADLLHLRDPGAPGRKDLKPHAFEALDGSLQFHACHGAMRQVEVLRDELLRLFRDHPDLEPQDVVVMTPDTDRFAPLIDAVFGDGDKNRPTADSRTAAGFPAMPFRIADRHARGLDPVAEAILHLLDLLPGRLPASEVLDLLAMDPVARRFDLDPDDLRMIRTWVAEARIRWGIDANHRQAEDQPADRQNTWDFGLDRLALGLTMPRTDASNPGVRLFDDVLPYDEVEGQTAQVLGQFLRFSEALFETRHRLGQTDWTLSLPDWQALVSDLIETFVAIPQDDFWQVRLVRDAMADLAREARTMGLTRPVHLSTLLLALDRRLASGPTAGKLLRGGINFSALVPMRSIPFRVVCLLGLDDGVFPRQERRPGFDRMGHDRRRPGDRSPRDDDRHLFLETLLSARDAWIVLWNGRDLRTNTDLPPAVPVGELLDTVARSFVVAGKTGNDLRQELVQKHPLQAFSPEAFRPGTLPGSARGRSFDARSLAAARALKGPRREPWSFFGTGALPAPSEWTVTVDDLASFFRHPARFLIQRRLEVDLGCPEDPLENREPISLQGLDQWEVQDQMLRALLRQESLDETLRVLRLDGRLPLGQPGEVAMKVARGKVQAIWDQATPWLLGDPLPTLVDALFPVAEGGPAVRVMGSLDGIRRHPTLGPTQVLVRASSNRPEHLLAAWVRHLVACVTVPEFSGQTFLIGKGAKPYPAAIVLQFRPQPPESFVDRARVVLADLLHLYQVGWCRPLLLFPNSGHEYVHVLWSEGHDEEEARQKAREKFGGENSWDHGGYQEAQDLYWTFVLGDVQPWDLDATLPIPDTAQDLRPEALARRVFAPLWASWSPLALQEEEE